MRSFLQFLLRNYAVLFFLLLEGVSVYMIFTFNRFHHTLFINSANELTGNVLNTYGNFKTYFRLDEINDSLIAENARLHELLVENYQTDTAGAVIISDSFGNQLYKYIPAEIISNSYTKMNNYITLDKGASDGIEKNMGVISSNGIVGKVVTVSKNFSVVMSVLHSRFRASVSIKRNNTQGSLEWDIPDPGYIHMVEVSEQGSPMVGDTIITTRKSSMFPPGIVVGTISKFWKEAGDNYYTLLVKLSTDFSSVRYTYVVNDLMSIERDSLLNEVLDADR